MQYLIDSNIFIHEIADNIYSPAKHSHEKNCPMCVTPIILNELKRGYHRECAEEISKEIYLSVCTLTEGNRGIKKLINIVEPKDVSGASGEYRKIRERYYSWQTDPGYLQRLIDKGILTAEEIATAAFREKDKGECELLAVAKAAGGIYSVVSNDVGRVYLHPDQNIFDKYVKNGEVRILWGKEWLREIGYIDEK